MTYDPGQDPSGERMLALVVTWIILTSVVTVVGGLWWLLGWALGR